MSKIGLLIVLLFIGFNSKAQSYDSLNNQMLRFFNEKKYKQTITIAKDLLPITAKKYGDTSAYYASILSYLSYAYENDKQNDNAEKTYQLTLVAWGKASGFESLDYAILVTSFANFYLNTAKYNEAEKLYLTALAIKKTKIDTTANDYLFTKESLALNYEKKLQYGKAITILNEIATVRKKNADQQLEYAYCIYNLSRCLSVIGDDARAVEYLNQSIKIYTTNYGEDNVRLGEIYHQLACTYIKIDNIAMAEKFYKKAIVIIKREYGEQSEYYRIALLSLSYVYQSLGNYIIAEELIQKSIHLYKANADTTSLNYAMNLDVLSCLYWYMGKYKKATPISEQAIKIAKLAAAENTIHYSSLLNNLANLYEVDSNYAQAEILLNQSLKIKENILGKQTGEYAITLSNIARLQFNRNQYTIAEKTLKEVERITKLVYGENHSQYAQSLNDLYKLYNRIEDKEQMNKYMFGGTNILFNNLKNNFTSLSENEKILSLEKSALDFSAPLSLLYNDSILSKKNIVQLLNQQLQLKGFILSDGIRTLQNARKNGSFSFQKQLSDWQNNKSILAKQYSMPITARLQNLDSLEKLVNEQEKQINEQSTVIAISKKNLQMGFKQVQQQLKQNEAAIEFVRFNYYRKGWTDSVLYAAFILLPTDTVPKFVFICEEQKLASILDSKSNTQEGFIKQLYRSKIKELTNQSSVTKGDSLYELIIKPLQPFLKNTTNLYIAPAGLLNRIAFDALPIDKNTLLIDKYKIRQYNSVKQLAEQTESFVSNNTNKDVIFYGGVNYTYSSHQLNNSNSINLPDDVKRGVKGDGFNYLPGTLEEVKKIKTLFSENKIATKLITDTSATEENFKALSGHSPSIIHLSTHGFSIPNLINHTNSNNQFALAQNPLLRSGVVMAGANAIWNGGDVQGKEDGILTAYEISNLDLSSTELVVLSACETALGDIKGTEGVFGLQRAFKLAGVKNMIMSLWQVPDTETAELMTIFYSNKLKGLSIYDSFNKAKDTMRKKYAPYYWAAFILIE